jgi:hypothetical protein
MDLVAADRAHAGEDDGIADAAVAEACWSPARRSVLYLKRSSTMRWMWASRACTSGTAGLLGRVSSAGLAAWWATVWRVCWAEAVRAAKTKTIKIRFMRTPGKCGGIPCLQQRRHGAPALVQNAGPSTPLHFVALRSG